MSAAHDTTNLVAIKVPGTDSQIMAAEIDGKPMVALKPMCDAVGIDYSTQLRKLKARSWATVGQKPTVAEDGKVREMAMIDRRTMTMWLATLDEKRVSEDARPIVVAFQAEAADALDAYFQAGVAVNTSTEMSPYDFMRMQIDRMEEVHREAQEAKTIATRTEARVDAIEGRHNWFSALGYAIAHGHNTNSQYLARIGREASMIAKAHGIEPTKVQHAHYGKVNSYPVWIWNTVMEGRDSK